MERPFASALIDTCSHGRSIEQAVLSLLERDFSACERGLLVLNTSFHRREEVNLHALTGAMRTLFGSGVEALVIGSFLVEK